MSAANKAWASLLKRDLEELRLYNEDVAKNISEDTKLKMEEVKVNFMDTLRKLEERDSELSKLKRKEATRAMNQGTVRDPSTKVKTPSSYQETDEDEKTARDRAILTAELKKKQARQRAKDERSRKRTRQERLQKQERISNV